VIILQLVLGIKMKREEPYVQRDAKVVDLTPWKPAPIVGGALIVTVLILYIALADFSVLNGDAAEALGEPVTDAIEVPTPE